MKLMYPDPHDPTTVICARVPRYGIKIRWVDNRAAFEVLSIRLIFVG